ncbi:MULTISPECIES: hypothetical protein [Bacillus]|nr:MULTISPECIES: hypothetical protein [Bacillus]EEK44570.1 Erythromycin resistance protein [Bacillus cereus m1293]MBL3757558.1 hypothetical protein [Bacillus cereus]MBL3820661.1 hypothetical protein [Bacillus cereus]MBL3845521.1 hypothetical protein [Bacillus cereus]MEC4618515.1 hypothetical protein [Bacillus paranthracis]
MFEWRGSYSSSVVLIVFRRIPYFKPTNFLDVYAIEALERFIIAYEGTIE